jgi:hypothetical protein
VAVSLTGFLQVFPGRSWHGKTSQRNAWQRGHGLACLVKDCLGLAGLGLSSRKEKPELRQQIVARQLFKYARVEDRGFRRPGLFHDRVNDGGRTPISRPATSSD